MGIRCELLVNGEAVQINDLIPNIEPLSSTEITFEFDNPKEGLVSLVFTYYLIEDFKNIKAGVLWNRTT